MFSDLGVYTYNRTESVMWVWKYYYVFHNKINGKINRGKFLHENRKPKYKNDILVELF